jgi:hypothetical protein
MTDGGHNDAQMGMFKILKPFPGFESVYQDQAATRPIAFPGTREPFAELGEAGYAPNLLSGFKVPLGARVLVMIPMTVNLYTPEAKYAYQFIWRTRNQNDVVRAIAAQQNASAYHLPSEAPGRAEFATVGDGLIFLPGSSDVEVFEQGEPISGAATLNVKQQRYVPQITAPWTPPLLPDGEEATWQQGTYQFTSNENCGGPTWVPLWMDAGGDELCILAYKIDSGVWNFATDDKAFSNTYGTNDGTLPVNPNVGILISTGMMGS